MIITNFKAGEYTYSDDSLIWRYIDFSKYVDLLDSSCLFFPRLSSLRKIDPYEGSCLPFFSHYKKDDSGEISLIRLDKELLKSTFVNCWYLSDIESAALWKLFPKSNEGIAIQSKISKLTQAIESENNSQTIYMSSVIYGHTKATKKTNLPNSFNSDHAVFTKRQCFDHEKELRLVMYRRDIKKPLRPKKYGLKIKVDLGAMISEVIISPEAPAWMEDLVKRVTNKYGFSFSIKQSTLNQLSFEPSY